MKFQLRQLVNYVFHTRLRKERAHNNKFSVLQHANSFLRHFREVFWTTRMKEPVSASQRSDKQPTRQLANTAAESIANACDMATHDDMMACIYYG